MNECCCKLKEYCYKLLVIIYAGLCFYLAVNDKSAGLAVFAVAGALALVFLDLESFAEFSGAGFSAKTRKRITKLENDVEPIKSKETEPEEVVSSITKRFELESDSIKVLSALTNRKFSWRTISGLESETSLPKYKLSEILYELETKKLANTSKSSSGKEIWGATTRGYVLASSHELGA